MRNQYGINQTQGLMSSMSSITGGCESRSFCNLVYSHSIVYTYVHMMKSMHICIYVLGTKFSHLLCKSLKPGIP